MQESSATTMSKGERRLAAIMFTDIVGYSRLTQRDERRTLAMLKEHQPLVRSQVQEHQGREIKSTGDGFLIEFDSALGATRCAIEIQKKLNERNRDLLAEDQIHIRIGIHVGDVVHTGTDVIGDAVNIAARIEPQAEPDGICISEDVARQLKGKLDEPLERIPRRQLKNIEPVQIYRVVLPWSSRRPKSSSSYGYAIGFAACFVAGLLIGHFVEWPRQSKGTMHHERRVRSVMFSRNGDRLVSASEDKTIKIWNPTAHTLLRTITGHTRPVFAAAFSPDMKMIASAGADHTVRIWDQINGLELAVLKGHTKAVYSVAFSPDGRLLASGGEDNVVMIWDVASRKLIRTLAGHKQVIEAVLFSPDGRLLASGGDDEIIYVWEVETGKRLFALQGHSDVIDCLAFHPKGQWLASGSSDRTVKIWDLESGKEYQSLAGAEEEIEGVSFSPSGRFIAASSNLNIIVWNVENGLQISNQKLGESSIHSIAWSSSGQLAWGDEDGFVGLIPFAEPN